MKESDEKESKSAEENHQYEDVNEVTNSKDNLITPDKKSDSMKDLKSLDFNSADDVRQTIKAVFVSKMPNFGEGVEDHIGLQNDHNDDILMSKHKERSPLDTNLIEIDDCKLQNNKNETNFQTTTSAKLRPTRQCDRSRKRPGRPPKTGSSKRLKKPSISAIYVGKLSNIVFLRRGNESDSDIDSVIF